MVFTVTIPIPLRIRRIESHSSDQILAVGFNKKWITPNFFQITFLVWLYMVLNSLSTCDPGRPSWLSRPLRFSSWFPARALGVTDGQLEVLVIGGPTSDSLVAAFFLAGSVAANGYAALMA